MDKLTPYWQIDLKKASEKIFPEMQAGQEDVDVLEPEEQDWMDMERVVKSESESEIKNDAEIKPVETDIIVP